MMGQCHEYWSKTADNAHYNKYEVSAAFHSAEGMLELASRDDEKFVGKDRVVNQMS